MLEKLGNTAWNAKMRRSFMSGEGILRDIWKAYEHRGELVRRLRERRSEIEQAAKKLRDDVEIKCVEGGGHYKRYVAVDSAYDLGNYQYIMEYLVVSVAMFDSRGEASLHDLPEVDTLVRVDLEEEYSRRILEGAGAALELILAARYIGDLPVIYLDGSFATFVIKINSMLFLLKDFREDSEFFRDLWKIGGEAVRCYHRLLTKGGVVACPKMSMRAEFYDHYHLEKLRGLEKARNDALILNFLLDEGEYVEVPIQRHSYNLLFSDEKIKKELFDRINSAKVYYLKGMSGKIFKFEAVSPFDADAVYPLTLGKELLPLMEADRMAKDFLGGLLREGYTELENYRERR